MARIIVSAGHTQSNPGSQANGLREVDLTRAIARKLIPYLRVNDLITLSVPPDMELNRRVEWINATGYSREYDDIAIEVHINEGGKSGFQIWYQSQDETDSKDLANFIMDSLVEETQLPNQGIAPDSQHEFGSLEFLTNTKTISILIECLYIDNPDDAAKLKSENEVEKIARAIAKGVTNFFQIEFKEPNDFTVVKPKEISPQSNPTQANAQGKPIATNDTDQTQAVPNNDSQQPPKTYSAQTTATTFQQQIPAPTPIYNPISIPQNNLNINAGFGTANPAFGGYGGGFGQSPMGNAYGGTFASPQGTGYTAQPAVKPMTRDERKDMIIKTYKKLLGRLPNDNDLNYFINIAVTEENLVKRMIDSQEHLDMVLDHQEFKKINDEYERMKMEFSRIKSENEDQQAMLKNLTQLLHQKNSHLSQLRNQLNMLTGQKSQENPKLVSRKYKGNLSDRIFHFFSGILG